MYSTKQVEEMLQNYQVIKAEIRNIELDLQDIENNIGFRGASNDPRPSTPTYQFNSVVENEALSISREKAIESLKKAKHERVKNIERIENALSILTGKEEEVIRMYYFKKYSATFIARNLDRTRCQVYKIKSFALKRMVDVLNTGQKMIQK